MDATNDGYALGGDAPAVLARFTAAVGKDSDAFAALAAGAAGQTSAAGRGSGPDKSSLLTAQRSALLSTSVAEYQAVMSDLLRLLPFTLVRG